MLRKTNVLALGILLVTAACTTQGAAESTGESESELQAFDASQSSSFPTSMGQEEGRILPPDVLQTERYGAPRDSFPQWYRDVTEHYQATSECMVDKGWPEQILHEAYSPNASLEFQGWEVDPDRFVTDIRSCFSGVGDFPMPPLPTAEQAEKQYEAATSATECFRQHGVNMPDLPSKQKFMDQFMVDNILWTPLALPEFRDSPLASKNVTDLYAMCPW